MKRGENIYRNRDFTDNVMQSLEDSQSSQSILIVSS